MLILYGIILASLLLTLKLTDWMGKRVEAPKQYVLSDLLEKFAFAFPVWAHVTLFIVAVGLIYALTRRYERRKAEEKLRELGLLGGAVKNGTGK